MEQNDEDEAMKIRIQALVKRVEEELAAMESPKIAASPERSPQKSPARSNRSRASIPHSLKHAHTHGVAYVYMHARTHALPVLFEVQKCVGTKILSLMHARMHMRPPPNPPKLTRAHTHRQSTANFVEMPPSNLHRTAQGGKPEHGFDQSANIANRSIRAVISVYNSMTTEIYRKQIHCDQLLEHAQALRSDITPC